MKYVKGDLFEAPEIFIAHGCNAQGVMGSGVALGIKNKYPQAYLDYVRFIKSANTLKMSALGHSVITKTSDKVIMNLITQESFGRDGKKYVNYEAIVDSLEGAISTIRTLGVWPKPFERIAI